MRALSVWCTSYFDGHVPVGEKRYLFGDMPLKNPILVTLSAGSIPPALGGLAALEELSLRDNQLSGEWLGGCSLVPKPWSFPTDC